MNSITLGLVDAMHAAPRKQKRGQFELTTTIEGLTVHVTFNAEWQSAEPDVGYPTAGYGYPEIVTVHVANADGVETDITAWSDFLPLDDALDAEIQEMNDEARS